MALYPVEWESLIQEAIVGEARLVWLEKEEFVGFDSAGHPLVLSSQDPENAVGVRPSVLLMVAMAGCSAVDLVRILAKQRQAATGVEIAVRGEQEAEAPWKFTRMHVTYRVRGRALKAEGVAKAVELAEGNYCSVAASLRPQVDIPTRSSWQRTLPGRRFEILPMVSS